MTATATTARTAQRTASGASASKQPNQGQRLDDLEKAFAALSTGQAKTLQSACLMAGMNPAEVWTLLALKVSKGDITDAEFVASLLRELGSTKQLAVDAAEAASVANRKADNVDKALRATKVVRNFNLRANIWPIIIGFLVGAIGGIIVSSLDRFGPSWGWFVFAVLWAAVSIFLIKDDLKLDVPNTPMESGPAPDPVMSKPVSAPADTPTDEVS